MAFIQIIEFKTSRIDEFNAALDEWLKRTAGQLRSLVPEVNTPVIPLILTGQRPFAMFGDLLKYPWVRGPAEYSGHQDARQVVSDVVELLGPG